MKKLFFIFLLVAMPFQASWAAAAVYCQHQNEVKTQHFGHHEHKHDDAHGYSQPGKKSPLSIHADCLGCHSAVASMTFKPVKIAVDIQATPLPTSSNPIYLSLLPNRPEKPKWVRAA